MTSGSMPEIFAIVPISEFGGDELVLLRTADGLTLPWGSMRPGERVLNAASRIVYETTGLDVQPERLLYVLELAGGALAFGVCCSLGNLEEGPEDLQGEVVALSQVESGFEPPALSEVLVEDLRSGFVRPVAHLVEHDDGKNMRVSVTW